MEGKALIPPLWQSGTEPPTVCVDKKKSKIEIVRFASLMESFVNPASPARDALSAGRCADDTLGPESQGLTD